MQNSLKELQAMGIRILIISRSRWETITTHNRFPEFIEVLVPESQKDKYSQKVPNPILTTPDSVKGLGKLRNWILSNFTEETVIMIDDDIKYIYGLTQKRAYQLNKQNALEMIVNTAIMAKDAGCGVFGYNQTDIRKYNGTMPFKLCTWFGGVIGVIGRGLTFHDDKFKVDIDFCLQNLLVNRIVWCDNRYYFLQNRDNNLGGNSEFRSGDAFDKSVESLKAKWGKYVGIKAKSGSQIEIKLNVQRKQEVDL